MKKLCFRIITFIILLLNICFLQNCFIAHAAPFAKSSLILFDSYEDFEKGYFSGTVNDPDGFVKNIYSHHGYESYGKYISKIIKFESNAEEVFPSWNIICPKDKAGFRIYLRVSNDTLNWSDWYYMGSWGKCPKDNNKILKDEYGEVEIDTLYIKQKVKYIQYSIHMFSSKDNKIAPEVKLFALAYGERSKNDGINYIYEEDNDRSYYRLDVPYRSQGDEDRSISGSICSPTSVSMVMEYWGINIPTAETAMMAYDKEHEMYGIWPMAVQAASQYGFRGWVQIFKDWKEVEAEITRGRPVIATICFDTGELSGSFTQNSFGHVIVITGFDSYGNPICNDPAGRNKKEGIIIYNRKELEKAWLWESGVGYVIFK